uniref:VWFC domain-containing protein n=2 Tax=Stomoxys calcitrans TaxID=35570 RepID=A0A1I8PLK3_STOCA
SNIPHLCDSVQCPHLKDITCPEDSDIRELIPEPLILEEAFSNTSLVDPHDEAYAECCLSQKCFCRNCYIPDCDQNGEVVVEIVPESMHTPGRCCGKYECHKEPNCTEVQNTESYWLTNCQRCKCYSGQKMCHQSCDEGIKKSAAICESKNLNQFFEHGDTWKDGCYECECVNGWPKCVINFCKAVNCPAHRQVMLKDSCCPVCWPKGFAMPNGDEEYDEDGDAESGHHYDDDMTHDYNDPEDNIEPNVELKPIEEVVVNSTMTGIINETASTT